MASVCHLEICFLVEVVLADFVSFLSIDIQPFDVLVLLIVDSRLKDEKMLPRTGDDGSEETEDIYSFHDLELNVGVLLF